MDNTGYNKTKGVIEPSIALLGGGLLLANWIWQGYLDLTPGADEILLDSTHPVYYINAFILFLSTCCLLYLILSLTNANILKGYIWKSGLYTSILGMTLFAFGTLVFIVYGFSDSATLPDVVDMITRIGTVAMHIGAFPLGIALLKGKGLLKVSGTLFILQTPIVIMYLFEIVQLNVLVSNIVIGSFYGIGWIFIGFSLSRMQKYSNS